MTRQFVKFLAVGVLNAAFGYVVFAGLIRIGLPAMPALVLTYIVGVMFNFMTTGKLVFGDAERSAFPRFVSAYVVVYLFNVGVYQLFELAISSPLVAQALCVPVVAVFSFLLFTYTVFRQRG